MKAESKEATCCEIGVGRIIFGNNLREWRLAQLKDPSISIILQAKESGQRPIWQDVAPREESMKLYWSQWNALLVKDGVLFKNWESPNQKKNVLQIIVPREKVKDILEEAHDSPTGGHFGINKTLAKIRRGFYWATCKRDVENWCISCETCVAKRGPLKKEKTPLQIYNMGCPFERVQTDILHFLSPRRETNIYW